MNTCRSILASAAGAVILATLAGIGIARYSKAEENKPTRESQKMIVGPQTDIDPSSKLDRHSRTHNDIPPGFVDTIKDQMAKAERIRNGERILLVEWLPRTDFPQRAIHWLDSRELPNTAVIIENDISVTDRFVAEQLARKAAPPFPPFAGPVIGTELDDWFVFRSSNVASIPMTEDYDGPPYFWYAVRSRDGTVYRWSAY